MGKSLSFGYVRSVCEERDAKWKRKLVEKNRESIREITSGINSSWLVQIAFDTNIYTETHGSNREYRNSID